ncbi:NAD-dependent epimerase [Halobacteriovorax sp. HLS]|uniref:NAD-dependent epimerase n=1 Tax=Halobacteriovorax sp. HLS TaxID=2234000 RepID=UPI000FDCD902|nr:NAD-dependent epimerase [Halobacteriovorax sp. HLS]
MKVLITGSAGFIGYHCTKRCVELGYDVVGIDSINDYYDVQLKEDRLKDLGLYGKEFELSSHKNLKFKKIDISNHVDIMKLFSVEKIEVVIHLAAQAGVRYSIEHPHSYIKSNAEGFLNILEGCRNYKVKHLLFASSSSVYGMNEKVPFSVNDPVAHPVSLYAATKRSNELMAHTYSHLYGIPATGLRFFTVYGPWGRPDMAPFLFTKSILNDEEIKIFNNGEMERDFTYIDDVIESVIRLIDKVPEPYDNTALISRSTSPYRIFNIGSSRPIKLLDFVSSIERATGINSKKKMMPMQDGDVITTFADVSDLSLEIDFKPSTLLNDGVLNFVNWFRGYYKV